VEAGAKLLQTPIGIRAVCRLMFGLKKDDVRYIFNKNLPLEKGFYINFWFATIYNPMAENKPVEGHFKIQ
jgi:hypothetical protein